MNKKEIIYQVATQNGFTQKDVDKILTSAFSTISTALAQQDTVRVAGFGTFKTRVKPARTAMNPKTRVSIEVAERIIPTFKPGNALNKTVNKK